MYILTGVIGMLILGFFNAWVDVWMLAGFVLGALAYGIYYMIKNSNSGHSGSSDGLLPGCILFAIIGGILEGL